MPNVLILKISPPMQSWGVGDLYDSTRKTNRFPTKSGVVGMLAAALGWDRDHDLNALNALRMGVRIDSPGDLEKDFQMIKKPGEANGKPSDRWYISDAVFVVVLQSDDLKLLESLQDALLDPVFNVFAGRKAFPVNFDLVQGVHEGVSMVEALKSFDWVGRGDKPDQVEIIRDANDSDLNVETISDIPANFELDHREWGIRPITRSWLDLRTPAEGSTDGTTVDWLDMEDDHEIVGSSGDLGDLDFMGGEEV